MLHDAVVVVVGCLVVVVCLLLFCCCMIHFSLCQCGSFGPEAVQQDMMMGFADSATLGINTVFKTMVGSEPTVEVLPRRMDEKKCLVCSAQKKC